MPDLNKKKSYSFLTRTSAFRRLAKWAFSVCDTDKTGAIGKAELYAGILLVHVQLAKYAGAAACYPPTRQVINDLFDASDDDDSGTIDEDEFIQILVVCCGQIASRIFVYYSIIILLVPVVAGKIIDGMIRIDEVMEWGAEKQSNLYRLFHWAEKILTWGDIAEKVVSLVLFMLLIPMFFDYIDSYSKKTAEKTTVEKELPTDEMIPLNSHPTNEISETESREKE